MRITEKDIIKRLQESAEQYKPLIFMRFEEEFLSVREIRPDAIIEISMENGLSFKALVEIKTVANPKTLLLACKVLRDELNRINEPDLVPVVVAPYIGNRQSGILADEGVSWIDLSGNMRIQIPNRLYIERTGKPNKFPDTVPIRKIFQGTSSLVSRALLLKLDGFSSLYEITDFINSRNANITPSTVSKVLKSLEQELLVDKSKSLISARNPEKLLDRLTEGYIGSTERKTRKAYKFAADNTRDLFFAFSNLRIDYAACGFYAAELKGLAVTNEITIFVKDIERVRKAGVPEDTTFSNLTIIETNEPDVWFNVSKQINNAVVDDIELYLEMMTATPRGPEIAKQIKQRILKRTDIDG
jgi:hypothetical protein